MRTALALSAVTGTPFQIDKIRAGRARPGLMRQHMTAVLRGPLRSLAARPWSATSPGRRLFASSRVAFAGVRIDLAVGTAGSATLVLQTVLPALLLADAPSSLVLEGGTHNPCSAPFDFLVRSFLLQLAKMGARVITALERAGFYPAGGGRFTVAIEPIARLAPLTLLERGAELGIAVEASVAGLAPNIAERELAAESWTRARAGAPRNEVERARRRAGSGQRRDDCGGERACDRSADRFR